MGLCGCGCGASAKSRYVRGHNLRVSNPMTGRRPPNYGSRLRTGLKPSDYSIEDRGYETPCWIWAWSLAGTTGYGRVKVNGRQTTAHRMVWENRFGPIPAGLVIDHLCDQRACVNANHLRVVSQAENVRRSRAAKITREQAEAIRADPRTQVAIAADYGIGAVQVHRIKRGTRWAA